MRHPICLSKNYSLEKERVAVVFKMFFGFLGSFFDCKKKTANKLQNTSKIIETPYFHKIEFFSL